MKSNFTIFYSWQSDLKANRNLIQNCIEKAVKEITKKKGTELKLEINIDRDTKNVSGSPSISKTIFDKIDLCDIFICDITIINNFPLNNFFKTRLTPNPNVMVELGYAVNLLGWDRVICVNNLSKSIAEKLPFDLRGHRILNYNTKIESYKKQLIDTLVHAMEAIIYDYEKIISQKSKTKYQRHDYEIYNKLLAICSEETIFDSISLAVNSLFTNKYYLDIWDEISNFYSKTINKFIIEDLDILMTTYIKELDTFNSICGGKFHLVDKTNFTLLTKEMNGEKMTEEELLDYKQSQIYIIHKGPFSTETWQESDKRVLKVQDELYEQGEKVKNAYRQLIMEIKRKIIS